MRAIDSTYLSKVHRRVFRLPSLQPNDPGIGVVHVGGCCPRAICADLLEPPEEEGIVGVPGAVDWDIARKAAREGGEDTCNARQAFRYLEV